jgi:transposase
MDIQTSTVATDVATVYAAIELSRKSWLVGVQSLHQERPSRHGVAAADVAGLWRVLERHRAALLRSGARTVRVVTCYEAGRDGFWLHRLLASRGAESHVVDPGSIEVNRRARRAKSDGLDVEGLLRVLISWDAGERHRCRMVVVPSEDQEDARRPGRERLRLMSERTAQNNRIVGLLATRGIYGYRPLRRERWEQLAVLRCADGQALPPALREEIVRGLERLGTVEAQIAAVEKQRAAGLTGDDEGAWHIHDLMLLTSVGIESATMLEREVYFRPFANGRSVASYVGLSPSPYQSGARNHEQGISKAGNRRARSTAIELAWLWLQHQPDSALSRWYRAKLGENHSKRLKKILIVALARKLVVALWRYVTTGLVPEGAKLRQRKQRKPRKGGRSKR